MINENRNYEILQFFIKLYRDPGFRYCLISEYNEVVDRSEDVRVYLISPFTFNNDLKRFNTSVSYLKKELGKQGLENVKDYFTIGHYWKFLSDFMAVTCGSMTMLDMFGIALNEPDHLYVSENFRNCTGEYYHAWSHLLLYFDTEAQIKAMLYMAGVEVIEWDRTFLDYTPLKNISGQMCRVSIKIEKSV